MAKRKKKSKSMAKRMNDLLKPYKDRIDDTFTALGFDMSNPAHRRKARAIIRQDALDRIEEAAADGHSMSIKAAINRVMHSKTYMTYQEDIAHRFEQGLKNAGSWNEFRRLNRHQRFDPEKVTMINGKGRDLEFFYDNSTKTKKKTVRVSIKYVPNVGMTLTMTQE